MKTAMLVSGEFDQLMREIVFIASETSIFHE